MATTQVTINYPSFTAPIVRAKNARNPLSQRGISGGIEVTFADIPAAVLTDLLISAVTDYLHEGLKTIDKETATVEECQAAMKAKLAVLVSGAKGKATARKAPKQDPVRAEAKKALKVALQAMSDEKIDGRTLTSMVSELFKQYDAFKKAEKAKDEEAMANLQENHDLVADFIASARKTVAEQERMASLLANVVGAAAANVEATAKPTPTEKVKASKAAAKPAQR